MKNLIFGIAACFFILIAVDTDAQSNINGKHLIQIGEVDSVFAKKLRENRRFWVRLPEGATAYQDSPIRYPVLYVLDGESQMQTVCAILNQLAPDVLPEMIVVGIGNYKNRTRDLTPSNMAVDANGGDWVKSSGGGKQFTDFIARDLIPYVDSKYPTAKYRTLVGHSFGGLMTVNTLLKRPELFNSYLAIDPSLWWDDQLMLKELKMTLTKNPLAKKSLFISVAHIPDVEVEAILKDSPNNKSETKPIEKSDATAPLNFIRTLNTSKHRLDFTWKYYEDENHMSAPLISMYDGLRSIFSWYKMDQSVLDITNDPNSSAADTRAAILGHYEMLSEKFGFTVHPDEDLLNSAGYAFMERAPEKALEFFKMALEYYPKNANPYDSMADYYESQGDMKSALKFVTKAYQLSGSDYHKKRMEKLSNK